MSFMDTRMETAATRQTSRSRWFLILGVPVAFLASLVVTAATAMGGHVVVDDRAGLRSVGFGWPLTWVRQDQRSFDPPLPWSMGFAPPLENPTDVSLGLLLLNVLALAVAIGVVMFVAGSILLAVARGIGSVARSA